MGIPTTPLDLDAALWADLAAVIDGHLSRIMRDGRRAGLSDTEIATNITATVFHLAGAIAPAGLNGATGALAERCAGGLMTVVRPLVGYGDRDYAKGETLAARGSGVPFSRLVQIARHRKLRPASPDRGRR